ncbi:MAG: hypothetical protein LBG11_01885 [Bifidobacteriaceae bacterium]|jgi:hypothetical protein|nr:hypothetical protein [Bifidobacteriaceae bacterium]
MPPREAAPSRFPYRLAANEALANLRASPVRTAVSAAVGILLGALAVVAPTVDVGRITAYNDELVRAGSNLFAVHRNDGQSLDAARCDSLRALPGVVSAGGVAGARRVVSTVDAGVSFDLIEASPGYAATMWPTLQGRPDDGSARVGTRVASRLGISDSGWVPYLAVGAADRVEVVAASAEARLAELSNAIVVPVAPVGALTQCWVEAEPGAREQVEELLVGWFDEPVPTFVASFMAGEQLASSPADQLADRLSRWAPLAVVLVVTIFQVALWLARRAEVGLYGLMGLRGARLATMVSVDFLFATAAPVGAGMVAAACVMAPRLTAVVLEATAWDCLRVWVMLPLAPLAVHATATIVKPFDAIRGR